MKRALERRIEGMLENIESTMVLLLTAGCLVLVLVALWAHAHP